jgi:adenylate kinase
MDEVAKLEHQRLVEGYLEQNGVYDYFQKLMLEVIYDKPIDVVEYLIHRLENGKRRRVFLLGPLGANKYGIGKKIAEEMDLEFISSRDVIEEEVSKKSSLGKYFSEHIRKGEFIRDDAIVKAVMSRIETMEKKNKSYVLVGFPRSRVQALALQRESIIPDKVLFMENFSEEDFITQHKKMMFHLRSQETPALKYKSVVDSDEYNDLAANALSEYLIN